MAELLPIGTRVRFIGREHGERAFGIGKPGREHWLLGGAEADVVEGGDGYPRHRCPDHSDFPDCVCGGEDDGRIERHPPWRVAEYPCACGESVIGRAIDLEGEGISWEIVPDAALQEAQNCWDRAYRIGGAQGVSGPRPVGGGCDAD